jgi:glycosyltransferase involved in cell wall biosynthesis
MLSIIIATLDCELALARTLAALVPGAVDGLVSEAIVADGGSRDGDGTAIVADAAGCVFIAADASLSRRLKTAAARARAPFLLFLRPGVVLDPGWIGEARRFAERSAPDRAAVFRRGKAGQMAVRELLASLAVALGALPCADQGLLISHRFYDALGGHADDAADPEDELVRRIGRKRLTTLAAGATNILD